jgi:predicted TIM-barrel fold metal-dependent hydrolase
MSTTPLIRRHKKPAQPLPANATDSHCHVFGPFDRFPLAAERSYNVPEAASAAHEAMKQDVGLARTVLVQGGGHGTDNRAMVAALAKLGDRGRGVAVVEPNADDRTLGDLHAAGVRAVRVNFYTLKSRYTGDPAEVIETFARLVKPRGWHIQIFADAALLQSLEPALAAAKIDIVVDHMGLADVRLGVDQPGFQALLRLLRTGHVWVKLAGADRITRGTGRLLDAAPFMRALAETNIDRLVWGTDWPHIGFHAGTAVTHHDVLPYRPLDAGELLDVLATAIPDAAAREKVLSANPARLYFS